MFRNMATTYLMPENFSHFPPEVPTQAAMERRLGLVEMAVKISGLKDCSLSRWGYKEVIMELVLRVRNCLWKEICRLDSLIKEFQSLEFS